MKNGLIFLGSPRKEGNTEQLADALIEGARDNGYAFEKIRLSQMKLAPCLACDQCWSTGKPCIQNDGMNELLDKMIQAEVFVFATPIYYYNCSAQIKILFDRIYPTSQKPELIKGKKTVLLSACADTSEKAFDGAKACYLGCCEYCQWENKGIVLAFNSWKPGDVKSSGDWLEQAGKIGRSL